MKKKLQTLLRSFLIVTGILATCSCTIRQIQGETGSVSTTGTGIVYLIPDQASITMAIVTSGTDVSAAAAENAEKTTKVIEALIASDIGKDNISTTNYNIYQESGWDKGRQIPGNYRVSNEINIIVHRTNQCGTIIDTAIKAGANNLSSISFNATNAENAKKQARILALKQAAANAKLLADTGGARLGKILTISENDDGSGFRTINLSAKGVETDGRAYTTPVSAGKTRISVTVNVTYVLQ